MDEAADQEGDEQRGRRAPPGGERPEEAPVRDVAKGRVPAAAPEIGDARRGKRMIHQRRRRSAARSPQTAQQVKEAEVQQEDEAGHADPAREQRVVVRKSLDREAEQRGAEQGAGGAAQPLGHPRNPRRGVEKAGGVQARPGEAVDDEAGEGRGRDPDQRERLAREEDGSGQQPHLRPGGGRHAGGAGRRAACRQAQAQEQSSHRRLHDANRGGAGRLTTGCGVGRAHVCIVGIVHFFFADFGCAADFSGERQARGLRRALPRRACCLAMASTRATDANSCSLLRPAPKAIPVPAVIDSYRFVRPLGRGGMGMVWEAEDTARERRVAIKLIPQARLTGASRLPWEIRLARSIRDPHVVSCYGAGVYAGGVYLVMEFMAGGSVQALVDAGPLAWPEATRLLMDACAGVMALHARRIVHRDIKPANLLRSDKGVLKIADLGLAGRIGAPPGPGAPSYAGTPHYMSPEQCRGAACDARTDIYALGATYHALLTGATPYPDAIPLRVLFEHCSAPPPDPRRHRPRVPAACAAIVLKAMAKARADRFDSAHALRRALGAVLRGRSDSWRT
ncbi:MAG: protein kinase [Gemmataceae bacterium]